MKYYKLQILLEVALAAIVVGGWVFVARDFSINGYLPPPFVYDTMDDFMDWYNPAYWAHNFGTYSIFNSVYPPLTFLFMDVFSNGNCYSIDSFHARSCDKTGIILLITVFILNIMLTMRALNIHPRPVALARSLSISLGLPMVMALDRGNVIVLAYFFFVLGIGRILRQSWAKAVSLAVVINFKIYLLAVLAAPFLKRKWRFTELALILTVIIYVISWVAFGAGSPQELFTALTTFSTYFSTPGNQPFSGIFYAGSYLPIYRVFSIELPMMQFVGSWWVEAISIGTLLALHIGQLCVLVTYLCALWRPADIPLSRLVAQSVGLVMITTEIGGYSAPFMIFALFLETRRSIPIWFALVAAYVLCIPIDHIASRVAHQIQSDYLSGREVGYDLGVSYGMAIRPALVIAIQYALAAASILDVIRARSRRKGDAYLVGSEPIA